MGRDFKNQAVVKAYNADGDFLLEEILSLEIFDTEGSELLSNQQKRMDNSVRFISTRTFDENGHIRVDWRFRYDRNGTKISDVQ